MIFNPLFSSRITSNGSSNGTVVGLCSENAVYIYLLKYFITRQLSFAESIKSRFVNTDIVEIVQLLSYCNQRHESSICALFAIGYNNRSNTGIG